MIKYHVTLSKSEREDLLSISNKGSHRSQKVLNSLILLGVDESQPLKERLTGDTLSKVLKVSMKKIDRLKKRFVEEGLDIALNGHQREPEYEPKVDGEFEAKLIALSCSEVPEGFTRWSLRLLADKMVELKYIDSISHETVRRILKNRITPMEEKAEIELNVLMD